VPWGGEFY
jgi:hypothetical protein